MFHLNEKEYVVKGNGLKYDWGKKKYLELGGPEITEATPAFFTSVERITIAKEVTECGYKIPSGATLQFWLERSRIKKGILYSVKMPRPFTIGNTESEANTLYFKKCDPTTEKIDYYID